MIRYLTTNSNHPDVIIVVSLDESLEITMEKITCPKCRGDGNESGTVHIQDLCTADRKKITELISELAR